MIIAIASGKGGTGKTFVATNLFHTLEKNRFDVTLIDCDAEAPNAMAFFDTQQIGCSEITQLVPVIDTDVCTYCGKCHEYCQYNAVFILPEMRVIRIIEELCHACGACSVACQHGAITEKAYSLGQVTTYALNGKTNLIEARTNIGVMSPVAVIKAALRQTNKDGQTIILDAPPGTSCPFIHTVSAADYVILVAEPTPFGLSDLKRSVDTLKQLKKPYGVIINRSGLGNGNIYHYLKDEGIELLLEIPFDKEIARFYSNGNMVTDVLPHIQQMFLQLTDKVIKKYGNSHYQR